MWAACATPMRRPWASSSRCWPARSTRTWSRCSRGAAVGLCGMDGHMITCKRKADVDLGYVGEIEQVDDDAITTCWRTGFIPVIATVGMDDNGIPYNINADTAAAEIAIALHAEKLVSMTDIVGLLYDKDDESTLIPEVEVSEIEGYKQAGRHCRRHAAQDRGHGRRHLPGRARGRHHRRPGPPFHPAGNVLDRGAGTMFERRETATAAAIALKGGFAMDTRSISAGRAHVLHTYGRSPVALASGEGMVATDAGAKSIWTLPPASGSTPGLLPPGLGGSCGRPSRPRCSIPPTCITPPLRRWRRALPPHRPGRCLFRQLRRRSQRGRHQSGPQIQRRHLRPEPQQGSHAGQLLPWPYPGHPHRHRTGCVPP